MQTPFFILITLNSFLSIGLIFNQNENTKETTNNQTSSSLSNPFEKITFVCLFLEFILLLFQTKLTNL